MAPHRDGDVIQPATVLAGGPYFEDLTVGQTFDTAPALTITAGHVAVHRSIVGDRLALALDETLSRTVTGQPGFVSPAVVWNIAIGQSTLVTQHVKANLFYRGLAFHRAPRLGDTLRTSTRVVALRQNRRREGRAPPGLAVLRITTADQQRRPVLDFWRCAMLPLRDQDRQTGHADDLDAAGYPAAPARLQALVAGWRLDRFARQADGPRFG